MRKILHLGCLLFVSIGFSQSLPIDFENGITTSDFVDFDGGTAAVINNPFMTGSNSSNTVAQIVRNGGEIYAGSKVPLIADLDFTNLTKITMKVFTTAPVGTTVKFKLEGAGGARDTDAITTVSGEWETLEWSFAGTPNTLNELVFMFDFGNIGDGTASSIFYFDDIEQVTGPANPVPATLPVNFENDVVTTDFMSFAGASASVVLNPQMDADNSSNTVGRVVKNGGEFWAGSFLRLTGNVDLNTLSQFSMKIYTDAPIGSRIKLELEGPNGKTDLDYVTTVSGSWETASWNFYGKTGDYDILIFMFNYGTVGDGTASSTFLFDDIEQVVGAVIPDAVPATLPIDFETSVVTSDLSDIFGAKSSIIPNPRMNADNLSTTVGQFVRSGGAPWAQSKIELTNFIDFSTNNSISMKVYTEAPVGTILKFKVESTVTGAANERDALTTVSGAWQTYTWDFTGDPPVYNVITLMLGYNRLNNGSPSATFLFDDIQQIDTTLSNGDEIIADNIITVFPNPASDLITIRSNNDSINRIVLYNITGTIVGELNPDEEKISIDISNYATGVYLAKVSTNTALTTVKIVVR
jgi:hypothetical protein